MIGIIISVTIFVLYITFSVIHMRKIPESISATYYGWGKKGYLFTLSLWGIGLPLAFVSPSVLTMLGVMSVAFIGTAASYKEVLTKTVHLVAAYCMIGFILLSIIIDYKMYIIATGLVLSILVLFFSKKRTRIFHIEFIAYVTYIIVKILSLYEF